MAHVGTLNKVISREDEADFEREEIFCKETSLAAHLKHQSWYLDFGCSRHMTGKRHMFISLDLKHGGVVGLGGDQKGRIIGSGTIGNDSFPSITNVLLVERLKYNLLSISQLSNNGYDIIFNQDSCKVVSQKDGSVLLSGNRRNNTYKIRLFDLKE